MGDVQARRFGMCDCARTREYCVTRGCRRDKFEWRYSTEGRKRDGLRRVVDLRLKGKPTSHWLRPEKAIAEAWLLNMEANRVSSQFILKLGPQSYSMAGVPTYDRTDG